MRMRKELGLRPSLPMSLAQCCLWSAGVSLSWYSGSLLSRCVTFDEAKLDSIAFCHVARISSTIFSRCRVYVEVDGSSVRKLYVTTIQERDDGSYTCVGTVDGATSERTVVLKLFST